MTDAIIHYSYITMNCKIFNLCRIVFYNIIDIICLLKQILIKIRDLFQIEIFYLYISVKKTDDTYHVILEDATDDGLKLQCYYTVHTTYLYLFYLINKLYFYFHTNIICLVLFTKLANLSNTSHNFLQINYSASCENKNAIVLYS